MVSAVSVVLRSNAAAVLRKGDAGQQRGTARVAGRPVSLLLVFSEV